MNELLLKENFKNLIPAIKGDWFLGDGGLLGIVRSGNIIPWDNDLDIFLLPGSYIDKDILKSQGLDSQEYYMDTKIFNPKYSPNHLNTWREFCSYYNFKNRHKNMNRAQLLVNASESYKLNKIKPKFTLPYIDVFYLDDTLSLPIWNITYRPEEMKLQENFDLGFKIFIPNNPEDILERQYGKDWRVERTDFNWMQQIKKTVLYPK